MDEVGVFRLDLACHQGIDWRARGDANPGADSLRPSWDPGRGPANKE